MQLNCIHTLAIVADRLTAAIACTDCYRSLATADFYDLQLMTAIAAAVTAHATGASSSSVTSSSGSSRPIASQDVSMLAWSFGHICSKHWTLGQCAVELMQQV
jgi:hypothetical protein